MFFQVSASLYHIYVNKKFGRIFITVTITEAIKKIKTQNTHVTNRCYIEVLGADSLLVRFDKSDNGVKCRIQTESGEQ